MKKVFKLEGLNCAHCAAKIEEKVGKLEGVKSVVINFMTTKMTLESIDDNIEEIIENVKKLINEVEPDYPSQAESIGYSKQVKVTVKFLVGLKGNVEKAEITQSHKDLGFDAEVMKAIKKWKFKPIYHNGKNIKVYFVKTFVFDPQ